MKKSIRAMPKSNRPPEALPGQLCRFRFKSTPGYPIAFQLLHEPERILIWVNVPGDTEYVCVLLHLSGTTFTILQGDDIISGDLYELSMLYNDQLFLEAVL